MIGLYTLVADGAWVLGGWALRGHLSYVVPLVLAIGEFIGHWRAGQTLPPTGSP